ncbi:MAG: DUF488 domain-containing protein, partial [Pseudomonadota bacterium]
MERTLVTIGYEKATLPDVIARLQGAGVRHLVDVRAVAASRRAGFAKRALSAGLEEAGIAYTHLRALGTPREGRDAARAGRVGEMHAIYAEAMQAPEALDAFEALAVMVVEERCALLCYEAEAHVCHRRLLTDRLTD